MGCTANTRGPYQGDAGAVRALLRDGLNLPAVQDLRRERQGRTHRAMWSPVVYALSHRLAGSGAHSFTLVSCDTQ